MKKTLLSKLILGGAILFSLPLLFSSCGNEDNPAVNPTPTPTPTPEGISYKAWNAGSTFEDKTATAYTEVTSSTTTWSAGTYVVNSDVTIGDVTITGDVELILCDGFTLTVNGHIQDPSLTKQYSLTIYGQSGGTGKVIASTAADDDMPIYTKEIYIHGGVIQTNADAPAFASSLESSSGIYIYGGTVTANSSKGTAIMTPALTVYNATITAISTSGGDGIQANGGTVSVYSGTVYAKGATTGINVGVLGTITLGTGLNFYTSDSTPVTVAGNIIASPYTYTAIKQYVAIGTE